MSKVGNDDLGHGKQPHDRLESEGIAGLREARNQLSWAAERVRLHSVRLGKWRSERGEPTIGDLSGSATLVKIGDRKGILTAAHNIRAKFPRGKNAHHGRTMEVIFGKDRRGSVFSTDVDLTCAVVKGGYHSEGEPKEMGPDIAWIPLGAEKASILELHGRVFFDWRDNRLPQVGAAATTWTDTSPHVAVGHLVTGYSFEREKTASRLSRPYLVEVAQDVFFPDRQWEIDGWDYQERVLDRVNDLNKVDVLFDEHVPRATHDKIPLLVDRVGGLSGGALWRFVGDQNIRHFDLVGVVWYQRWRDKDGVLRIVNHGRKSIHRVMTP